MVDATTHAPPLTILPAAQHNPVPDADPSKQVIQFGLVPTLAPVQDPQTESHVPQGVVPA